jgi:hypothetical protein
VNEYQVIQLKLGAHKARFLKLARGTRSHLAHDYYLAQADKCQETSTNLADLLEPKVHTHKHIRR